MHNRTAPFVLTTLISATVFAVPLQLTHQGRLLDSSDQPLTGSQTVTFTFWDASTGTNTLWTDDLSVTFDNGYYSVILGGSSNPIDENVLDNTEVWMSLTIGAEELLPRQRVVSAPYAVMAGTAENAATVGGYAPSDLRLAADDIDWADLHDVPADEDTLAALPCVDGQVAQLTSSGWACANVGTDTLAGLSCSTNDVAILTGSGWDCVALPDFTGWDTVASDDLVTSSMFAGDVAGPYDALGISAGAVSEGNLDFNTATQAELDAVAASIPTAITSVDGLTGGALTGNLSASGAIFWGSGGRLTRWAAGSDYDALLPASTSGAAIEGPTNFHLAVGIHGNEDGDSFSVCTDSNRDGELDTVGLMVNNVGNVGVGTSTPQVKLDVRNPTGNTIINASTPSGTSAGMNLDSDTFAFVNAPSSGLNLQTGGTSQIRIEPTGNVGVGTTNPQVFAAEPRVLDVAGSVKSQYGMAVVRPDTWGAYRVVDSSDSDRGWLSGMQGDQGFELGHFDGTAWERTFRVEASDESSYGWTRAPNIIGGYEGNSALAPGIAATIAGGGFERPDGSSLPNTATYGGTVGGGGDNTAGDFATIGGGFSNEANFVYSVVNGGRDNIAGARGATVGGGEGNTTGSDHSTVGGGWNNAANGLWSTVGGGIANIAGGESATIGGGSGNSAGHYAVVPGGIDNSATGDYSFAAGVDNSATGDYSFAAGVDNSATGDYSFATGYRAKANHIGSFVWADSWNADYASSASNRFAARAQGGVYFHTNAALTSGVYVNGGGGSWNAISDKNKKENFEPVDGRAVLDRVAALPMTTWNYKSQEDSIRHMGPMAQDFGPAFGLGDGELTINTVDADGVALAAIQGLNAKVEELRAEVEALKQSRTVASRSDTNAWLAMSGFGIAGLALFLRRRRNAE